MKRTIGLLAAGALAVTAFPADGVVARTSCASGLFTAITLSGFHPGTSFYVASETAGGRFDVTRMGDHCLEGEATNVFYSLEHETTSSDDLELTPETKVTLYAQDDGSQPGGSVRSVDIGVVGPIDGVEKARVWLDRAVHDGGDTPFFYMRSAPLYVLDSDGPSSVEMGETAISAAEGLTARVPVFRTGSASETKSITFTILPDSATPGEDYEVPSTSTITFNPGERTRLVEIKLLHDGIKEDDEQFTVRLEGVSEGVPNETTVTIVDATLKDLRPKGRIHHPKQNFKYPQNYPWLNEIHIFTSSANEADFQVDKAQLAIRKRWKGGACAWWKGDGFAPGKCQETRWFGKGIKNPDDNYFLYKIRQRLPRSVGPSTKVRDYKIWGRWYDTEDRVSILKKGRNLNRFEVIKPTKACSNPETRFNFRKCKPVRP